MEPKHRLSFYDEIARNKRNSMLLVLSVLILLLALVYAISLAVDPNYTFFILIFGTIFSIVYVTVGYSQGSKIALASVGAKPASHSEYRMYHNLVEGICLASGMPKPKL